MHASRLYDELRKLEEDAKKNKLCLWKGDKTFQDKHIREVTYFGE